MINFIKNADFNNGFTDWNVSPSTGATIEDGPSPTIKYLTIIKNDCRVSQKLELKASARYEVTGGVSTTDDSNAQLVVETHSGEQLALIKFCCTQGDFTFDSAKFSMPANTTDVFLRLQAPELKDGGTVYFTQLRMTPAG